MNFPALLALLLIYIPTPPVSTSSPTPQQLHTGFSASPDPASAAAFQPILVDHTGNFSLGFLRLDSAGLDLAVLHLPSAFPLWRAAPSRPMRWEQSTVLSFNATLALSDSETGLLWSTPNGHSLILNNSSNLQLLNSSGSVVWQSFEIPSDTLVQYQNFTAAAALFSSNRRFSMRLGTHGLSLHLELGGSPMYWKRTALAPNTKIEVGAGPIYARVEPVGYLGMYQNETAPVDVLAFDSFNRGISGFRRLTLEADGNLRAYYWNGSTWVLDFEAVTIDCGLPSSCGQYEVCSGAGEPRCRCLDEGKKGCFPASSGDLCQVGYRVVRRKGVDLANKELLGFQKMGSLEDCEGSCEQNCSCWGAVYSGATGSCYRMDYPAEMVVAVGDERKVGYFKVRDDGGGDEARRTETALLVAGAVVFVGGAGFVAYRFWKRKGRDGVGGSMLEGISAGPYKGLSSTSSFRSVELSNSLGKSES